MSSIYPPSQSVQFGSVTIFHLNRFTLLFINLLNNQLKRTRIFNYLKKFNADVILLQETHVLETDLYLWKANIYINTLNEYWSGQMIILNNNEEGIRHDIFTKGRCQTLELVKTDTKMRIVNIYAPNRESEQLAFFKNAQEHLLNCTPVDLLIIRGDMNITIDNKLDKQNGTNNVKKASLSCKK